MHIAKLFHVLVPALFLTTVVVGKEPPKTGAHTLPLTFEVNRGQATPEFGFVAQTAGVSLQFSKQEILFRGCAQKDSSNCPPQQLFRMRFHSGQPARVSGEEQSGSANYYIGKDPSAWRTGIPMYRRLRYREIYPGIDLLFHGYDGTVEYDLIVAPRANPSVIALELSGTTTRIEGGELVIDAGGQYFRFKRPEIYQEIAGTRHVISGEYVRRDDGMIGFHVGAYDHQHELVIDPVVTYASYIGGKPGTVYGTAVDASGNVILTGETSAANFPVTTGAVQPALSGSTDAFISKIDPTGQKFVYSTYFGGSSQDRSFAAAIDGTGNVYITGVTSSYDLPTTAAAFSKTCPGICNTPFAAKFGPDGSLIYSTYLGSSNAVARAIAVDSQGSAYITGDIASADLPLVNAFQSTLPEQVNTSGVSAFVQKLDASGSSLTYSTYLGGLGEDIGRGIAVDSAGSAYVVGNTAGGFPVRNPLQADGPGAFITKFTPGGTDIVYSTLFGGSSSSEADAVTVDAAGAAYITGVTSSTDFPLTPNAFKTVCTGGMNTSCATPEAFALVLEPNGTSVRYSTFLGEGAVSGIATDASSNVYISGWTNWSDFPLVNAVENAESPSLNGANLFVTELNAQGTPSLSTVLGGYWTSQTAGGIAVNNGTIYIGGTASGSSTGTTNPDFPLVNAMTTGLGNQNSSPVLVEVGPGSGAALSVSPRIAPLVVLRNLSSSTLTFHSITTSADFEQSGDCGSSLAPGTDCILYLRSTNTASSGTLTIDSSASSTPEIFTITKAAAVDQSTSAYLVISPTNQLRFPPTLIGESATRSVLVRNVGLGTGSVFLNTGGNFQSTNHCAGGVAPGGSCTIDVTFTPTIAGPANGQLGINNNATTIYLTGWGSATPLSPSASSVNFGTQYVGFPGFSRTITLQNATSESQSYSGVSVSSAFAATSDCPATIPARGSCHVTLTFSPTTNASYQSSLTSAGAASVALIGTGRILSDLAISSFDVEYGYVLMAGPYPTQNVTVTNKSANTVNISAVSVTGDFSQSSNCVGALAPQAACTIAVKFIPTSEGDLYGQLSIAHSGTGSPQQASLHGIGENYIRVTPSSIDFGHEAVGTTSAQQFLGIANNSNLTLTISSITVSDDEFAVVKNFCSTTLQPIYGCGLQFTFTPTSPGLHQATVTFTTSNPASTETATLQGIGDGPEIALSAQSLDFGAVELGSTAPSQNVLVTNSGNTDAQISSISASGDFTETNTCPATLAAGAQCSITVSFKPSSTGARSGTVSIAANVSSSPRTVALAGSGADFQFAAPPSGATSQTVKAGQTATFTLQVSGSSGFSDSVTFACANVPAGYTCSPTPKSITVGATVQTVTIAVATPVNVGGMTAPGPMSPLNPSATLVLGSSLALLMILLRRRKRPVVSAATVLSLILLASCGGGGSTSNPPPPPPVITPQTQTITVTATSSAGVVKSMTLTVTVD